MAIKMNQMIFLAATFAAPLFASETFGGIGVSIYQSQNGTKIIEVVPGTPAEEAKLQAGDVIIAVDGESLKGLNIEESKGKLRGQKNKPLEIAFIRGNDTLSTTIRRTQITVKNLESDKVESWYNKKVRFNAHELETFATASEGDKELVAVLQHGTLVKSNESVSSKSLNGIYIEKEKSSAPKTNASDYNRPPSAKLTNVSRTYVAFDLNMAGKATISITNADGVIFAKIVCNKVNIGSNFVNWNSENVPDGRYIAIIEHNGTTNSKNIVLK